MPDSEVRAQNRIIVVFKSYTRKNAAKSRAAGRPIFDEMEVCEVRFAGNRDSMSVFPAHAFARWVISPDGAQEPQTYAQRWPDQYRRFKMQHQQIQEGTPLDELTFLSASKQAEMKALNIHTAESLAALDGAELKMLGMGGRDLKNQAQAYLDKAAGNADVAKLAADNADLRAMLADMQQQMAALAGPAADTLPEGGVPDDTWEPSAIKDWIEAKAGMRPRGNPSQETLLRMAADLRAGQAEAA